VSSDDNNESSTEETLGERASESRLKLWVLLRSDRLVLTTLVALVFFVAFILVVYLVFPPFQEILASDDSIDTLFEELAAATITAVTLVLTISQLVVSQEIGPVGDQRNRMSETMEFRQATSELIGESTPGDPSTFLKKILDANADRADALGNAIEGNSNDDLREQVDELVDNVTTDAEGVSEQVEDTSFGTFDIMFAALNYDYSSKLVEVDQLLEEFDDDISEDERAAFEELRTALTMYSPAREHIKTLYFQWELISLTQNLVYLSIPALFVAGTMVAAVKPSHFPGAILGIENILWVFGGAFTVSVIPFFLTVVYLLRIATVAKRTLAIGPLILRGSEL
jgi:hypothetical protein